MLRKSASAHLGDSLAWLLGAVVLMVAAGLSAQAILQIVIHPITPAEAAAKIGLWPGLTPLMRPEPVKNALYIVLAPLGAAIAALAAWASARPAPPAVLTWTVRVLAVCSSLMITWWLARMDWRTILPETPSPPVEAVLTHPLHFALFAVLAAALAAGLAWKNAGRTAMALALVPLLLLSRFTLLQNGDGYAETNHFEVFSYPIFQDWLGQGLFVGADGQKSQYGMYLIFLRPIWLIFGPPSVVSISAVMAVLLAGSQFAVVGFMARFSANRVLGVAVSLAAITTSQLLYTFWPGDPYFQFFPIRLVFPAVSMALLALGVVSKRQQWLIVPLLCLGLLWNFESGVVGVAMYVVHSMALEFEPNWRSFLALVAKNAIRVVAGVVACALGLIVYYMVRFHAGPNFALLVDSLKAFSSGMSDQPMPPFGAWGIHCLIYLTSGFLAFRTLGSRPVREEKMRAAALLAMTVSGVLWFRYYQGRALPPNLTTVSAPAICCLGLIVDQAIRMSQRTRVASILLCAALSGAFLGSLGVWQSTHPFGGRSLANLYRPGDDAGMNRRLARVRSLFKSVQTGPADRLIAFAPYAGELNMSLQHPGLIKAAGACQIFYQSEVNELAKLAGSSTTKLIAIDPSDSCGYMNYPEISKVISGNFHKIHNPIGVDSADKSLALFYTSADCNSHVNSLREIYLRDGSYVGGAGPDLALDRLATQSSTLGEARADRAVDGNTCGRWPASSISHTDIEQSPWWQVDLGVERRIGAIFIWNRTDCCGERLSNYWVFVSKIPFRPTDTLDSLKHRPDVVGRRVAATPDSGLQLKFGSVGRYVRVQLEGKEYLALAEVKVFGE